MNVSWFKYKIRVIYLYMYVYMYICIYVYMSPGRELWLLAKPVVAKIKTLVSSFAFFLKKKKISVKQGVYSKKSRRKVFW